MKQSTDLFDLIQSMSPAEKRYFKIFATRHTIGQQNNYVKLFDVVEKQRQYDEEKVKNELKGEKFISDIAVYKSYLHQLILDGLHSFYLNSSVESKIKKQMDQLSILFNKGLYTQGEKLLQKTKSVAIAHEKYYHLLSISDWELSFIRTKAFEKTNESRLSKIFAEEDEFFKKYKEEQEYYKLLAQVAHLISTVGQIKSDSQEAKYRKVMSHKLLSNENIPCTFQGKLTFYNIWLLYFMQSHRSYKKALKFVSGNLKLFEDHPEMMVDKAARYVTMLTNIIMIHIESKKYDTAHYYLKKAREFPAKYKVKTEGRIALRIFSLSYLLETHIYVRTGAFEKIGEIKDDIERGLKQFDRKIPMDTRSIIYFNMAYMYFGNREYHISSQYLNKIANNPDPNARQDIICLSKILLFIVYYELDDTLLFQARLKSTQRYLVKRNNVFKLEAIILEFIKKLPKLNSKKELVDYFKQMKKELEEISKIPFEQIILKDFDFIAWVESKIENRPFAEMVKRRASAGQKPL